MVQEVARVGEGGVACLCVFFCILGVSCRVRGNLVAVALGLGVGGAIVKDDDFIDGEDREGTGDCAGEGGLEVVGLGAVVGLGVRMVVTYEDRVGGSGGGAFGEVERKIDDGAHLLCYDTTWEGDADSVFAALVGGFEGGGGFGRVRPSE